MFRDEVYFYRIVSIKYVLNYVPKLLPTFSYYDERNNKIRVEYVLLTRK